tara:strand:- start:421 stop:531 length:111 start_codon:yes stop_codon:yes gene_type:complete
MIITNKITGKDVTKDVIKRMELRLTKKYGIEIIKKK